MGQDCRGVVVVTENLADVAPATSPDAGQPCVVFLDRRAILMDPTWVFAASGTLSVDNLTAQYEEFLPEGLCPCCQRRATIHTRQWHLLAS